MPSFEKQFIESAGRPIVYQGHTLVMSDTFPTCGRMELRLVFEACNGEWRQGVRLESDGECRVNGKQIAGGRGIILWEDSAPRLVVVDLIKGTYEIRVNNIWDTGNGMVDCWHNGAAMIVEELPNGRRYRCNDGFADDDFDDIVFRLERV